MLIELFVSNLREIAEKSYKINVQKYKDIYNQCDSSLASLVTVKALMTEMIST